MKRKILFVLGFILICSLACVFAACGGTDANGSGSGGSGDGHKHNYTETLVPPTCTEKGYTLHECSCGANYKTDEISALGHTPAAAKEENRVEATCGAKGSYDMVVYCSVCGAELSIEHKEIPATGLHDYRESVIPPTCTEKGYTLHKCSCGDEYKTDETAALGHDYEWTTTKEPTETEKGEKTGECSRCGDTVKRDIPELNHEHDYHESVIPPTCTEKGYTLHECDCGDSYKTDETEMIPHDYRESVIPPKCTEQGYTLHVCSRCGHSYKDTYTAATGHTPAAAKEENRTEATCGAKGSYDSVVYCSVCAAELSREHKEIPATGLHDYHDGVCSACGAKANVYTVTFYFEDGKTVYYTKNVVEGDSVLIPTEAPKDETKRKEFVGWGIKDGEAFSETAYEFASSGTTLTNVRQNMEFRALYGEYIYTPICS